MIRYGTIVWFTNFARMEFNLSLQDFLYNRKQQVIVVSKGSFWVTFLRHLTSQPRDQDDAIPWEKGWVKSNSRMRGMSRMPAITSCCGKRVETNLNEECKYTNPDNRQARGGVLWRVTYPKKPKSPECVEIWQIDRFRYEEYENNIIDNRQPRGGWWGGSLTFIDLVVY